MAVRNGILHSKSPSVLDNERGLATIETLPLLFIFLILMGYGIGAFGIVHTGILHNIAARVYAFETFRHRANLVYFRENNAADPFSYRQEEIRLHAVKDEGATSQYVTATERPINFGFTNEEVGRSVEVHNRTISSIQAGERTRSDAAVNPAWIKIQYGICINASCGGQARGQQ